MCASLARLQGLEFDSGNWDTRIYDQDLPSQKHFSMHAKWPGISQDMCCDHMCIFFIIIIKVPFSKLHKQYHTAMELCAEVQPWKVIHAAIPQNFSDAAVLSKHCYMPIWQLIVQERHNLSDIVKSVKSRSENWAFNKWPNLTCSSLFNRHSTVHKTEPNIVANAKKKLHKSFLNHWDNMYNQLHARQFSFTAAAHSKTPFGHPLQYNHVKVKRKCWKTGTKSVLWLFITHCWVCHLLARDALENFLTFMQKQRRRQDVVVLKEKQSNINIVLQRLIFVPVYERKRHVRAQLVKRYCTISP